MPLNNSPDFFSAQSEALKAVVPLAVEKFKLDQANDKWEQQMKMAQTQHQIEFGKELIDVGNKSGNPEMIKKGMGMYSSALGMPDLDLPINRTQMDKEQKQTGVFYDNQYRELAKKQALGVKLEPEEIASMKAYEKQKTLGQEAYGDKRIQALLAQPIPVYDTNTGNFELKTKEEIVRANKDNQQKGLGSRFVGEGSAKFVKPKIAAFNEIEVSAQQVRDALKNLKGDFSQKQIAKFSQVLNVPDDGSTIKNFLATNVAKTLTPDEIEYITAVKNLRESSFALRGISGMGQGSDMLRGAIADVVPGARTPNKAYAESALNRFDTQVATLKKGIPGLGKEGQGKAPSQINIPTKNAKGWILHTDSNGNKAYVSPDGKQFDEVK
jgi:hypothetical protein